MKPPLAPETTVLSSQKSHEPPKPAAQTSEEQTSSSEQLCEPSRSNTHIDNPRPLETVAAAYRTQKKAHQEYLEQVRETQQRLSDLQQQVQNDQTEVSNQKKVFEISQRKFKQCHQFEPTEDVSCSAEEQQQAYSAFQKAGKYYQNSQKVLNQHQQEQAEVEKLLPQEQEALKSEAEKLDELRRELRASVFQRFMEMEDAEMLKVLEVLINSKDSNANE